MLEALKGKESSKGQIKLESFITTVAAEGSEEIIQLMLKQCYELIEGMSGSDIQGKLLEKLKRKMS